MLPDLSAVIRVEPPPVVPTPPVPLWRRRWVRVVLASGLTALLTWICADCSGAWCQACELAKAVTQFLPWG